MRKPLRSALISLLLAGTAISFAAEAAPPRTSARSAGNDNEVILQADNVTYNVEAKVVTASGRVEINYGGRTLIADRVSYDQNADTIRAEGNVSVMDINGDVAFARNVVLTDKMREGALQGFGALIGENGRLVAASAKRSEGRFTEASRVAYTPCKICDKDGERTPVWRIRSSHVVHDEVEKKIVFRDAVLDIMGVPVFYTPYLSQPDPTVKYATGLLTPAAGTSSSLGYFVKLPVYISLSEHNDMTIAPRFTTKGGQVLEGEYRERFKNGGFWFQGSAAHNPNGGLTLDTTDYYSHIFGGGDFDISRNWHTGFNVQLSSNDTYLKRYDISQAERLVSNIFLEGLSGRSRFTVNGYYFQGLRAGDTRASTPFVLPLIEYNYIPQSKWMGGRFRADISTAVVERDLGVDDQRVSATLSWRLPLVADNGQLFTFRLSARGDFVRADNFAAGAKTRTTWRGLPEMDLEWRWPFISATRSASYIVEPIAQLIAAPYLGAPTVDIPNEDGAGFEFDDNNVFSFNRLPGYSRIESGPRVNIGLRTQADFKSGSIEALIGQTFRAKPDPVFVAGTGQDGTVSDLVSRVSLRFPPWLDVTHRMALDRKSGTIRRNELYATATRGRSALQIGYVNLAPSAPALGFPAREEVNAQLSLNVYRNWVGFGALRRDLIGNQLLETELGLGYEDDCLGIALAYRRKFTRDRDLPPSTSVILRFNLKTSESLIGPFTLFPRDVFARN